jgi:2-keto-3-deoxy-L-rhamnonate aldolase RhmA
MINQGGVGFMPTTTLKALSRSKKPKFGTFIVEFSTPGIGHLVKTSGCEFVLYDMEHSGFGFETAKQAVRYFEAAGVAMIARVPSKDYDQIARIADMGAEGIMLPMVNNATEARHILDCLKYGPEGKRGVALGVAHDNYARTGDVADRLKAANKRTTLFCQIETAEGVENADAMAALDGVDCLWVGHFDLSSSLGIPGDFGHKKFKNAIDKVAQATRKHGKALGRLVPNVETGIEYNKWGFDFICYSGDVWLLQSALSSGIDQLRKACVARK